jgi:flagellar biogenesis protein FliO
LALFPAAETTARLGGTEGPDLARYFVVCAILILVTALVAWGFRRLVAGNLRTRAAKRSLQVIDVLPLGGKRRLAVVRCYDRTFVLGLGDREVSPIAELDSVIAPEKEATPSGADRVAFAKALGQIQNTTPAEEEAPPIVSPKSELRRTVKKKVRRRKRRPAPESAKEETETVAQAAHRLASAKRAAALAPKEKQSREREPATEKPSIPRLEGLLG